MVELTDLVNELKALRKGRGIFVSHIGKRVGAALRDVCDVTDADGPAVIRQKVARRLEVLAGALPADLRVAVMAAFGIWPDARLPLYQDRVSWAANRLNRDPRTARRRIDDGIQQLAQLATVAEVPAPRCAPPVPDSPIGWHTTELRITLALDRDRPEVLEQRRIIASRDGLTELDLAATFALPEEYVSHRERGVSVFYGGTLADRGAEPALALPMPLRRGQEHEFALHFRLPDGHRPRPHFACVPRHPCDLFDLRVRFGGEPPPRIWSVRSAFPRDVEEPVSGEPLSADPAGEIHLTFRGLTPGLAYGARWTWVHAA
jgi:hypothetical protein